jgi:hypothetical protein
MRDWILRSIHAGLLATALALAAPAQAATPTLQTASQSGGRISAAWSLPSGMALDYIEAGTSPATTPEGDFPITATALAESLDDFAPDYLASVPIPPGTYYVHVSAFSTTKCVTGDEPDCVDEWSNVLAVTIPGPPDKLTAFAFIEAPSPQRLGRLHVSASMPEPGTLTAAATVRVPGASKTYRFKSVSKAAQAGVTQNLRLKLAKRAKKVVVKALKHRKKVRVKVTITAKDKAGNVATETRTVKLRR